MEAPAADTPAPSSHNDAQPAPEAQDCCCAEDNLVVVEVQLSEEMKDCEDAEGELASALETVASPVWAVQYRAVEGVRRLCVFHPAVIAPHIPVVMPVVLESAQSLRSAVARNALLCLADMLANVPDAVSPLLDSVVDVLVWRAASDKRFIREAAVEALGHLSSGVANEATLASLFRHASSRHPAISAVSSSCADNCLQTMGAAAVRSLPLPFLLTHICCYLLGKSADARRSGVSLVNRVRSAVGVEAMERCSRDCLPPLDADVMIRQARATPRPYSTKRHEFQAQIRAAKAVRPQSCPLTAHTPTVDSDVESVSSESIACPAMSPSFSPLIDSRLALM